MAESPIVSGRASGKVSAPQLVLSLFPGIGLLDMAFEAEGFCVVRGPDLLWGGDIRGFHPPAGRFDGVIGGPPCQFWCSLAALNRHLGNEPRFGNMIPDFESVVGEAAPGWFLMENVPGAPVPAVDSRVWPTSPPYQVWDTLVEDAAVGGLTQRTRRFSFGLAWGTVGPSPFNVEHVALFPEQSARAVTGDARVHTTGDRIRSKQRGGGVLPNTGRSAPFASMLAQSGLPDDFLRDAPFTLAGKRQAVGNGVPLPMGRAVAKAVKRALGLSSQAPQTPL